MWHVGRFRELLGSARDFDVVDAPPLLAGGVPPRFRRVVARSVQPDLRYFAAEVRQYAWAASPLRSVAAIALGLRLHLAVLLGLHRSQLLLCLGSDERRFMERCLPWLRGRLASYSLAPSPEEQTALAAVRRRRTWQEGVTRFLWIGRWAPHKGVRRLRQFLEARVRTHPEDSFTIAGCGGEAASALGPALLQPGRVTIVERFERSALASLLANHDAGLFTSEAEGWGLGLQEMLESGLPVYATRVGAFADLAPFFLRSLRPFPPGPNPSALAPEDLEANGYYRRFSWPAIAAAYERDVLERITSVA